MYDIIFVLIIQQMKGTKHMGKQYTIGYIKADKQEVKGKIVDVMKVKLVNAENKEKWENILSFNKCFSAAAVCNAGDVVDVTYEKKTVNGKDFFNVVGFTRVGSDAYEAPAGSPAPATISGGSSKPSYGTKSDDTQLSICRQSSNTAAMNFVVGMLTNGIYGKKANPEMLFEEVKRFAKKFEEYVTLKADYGAVDLALGSIDIPTTSDDSDDGEQF